MAVPRKSTNLIIIYLLQDIVYLLNCYAYTRATVMTIGFLETPGFIINSKSQKTENMLTLKRGEYKRQGKNRDS